ncbi:MAG: ABC transporter ATP-binding protein [Oscillospiraceae bacterium]|jgi:ABC-2 type transport system ATP-binding protein|nr:ABC transporter ATP-binding protein [Oscillospiraceae bacterium]
MDNFVSVSKLTKRYGDFTAVDNLSFEVKEREVFGFLGPNGAGKSTTLHVICNLTGFDKGEISVGGHDLRRETRIVKSLIGLVPQEIALYPTLSAYENVAFFASLYGLSGRALKSAVLEALEFVGLSDCVKKRAEKMSGGMQRRLNIACGIAHKPKLIVMDEPTVGVDPQSREQIMRSIRKLRENGATIIYTSHYMPEVQEICDRIAIIDGGRLAASGTEEELLKMVTDVKTITIDCPKIDEKIINFIVDLPDVKRVKYQEKLKIEVPLRFTGISTILQALVDNGVPVDNLKTDAPNLETTFLALTGKELR